MQVHFSIPYPNLTVERRGSRLNTSLISQQESSLNLPSFNDRDTLDNVAKGSLQLYQKNLDCQHQINRLEREIAKSRQDNTTLLIQMIQDKETIKQMTAFIEELQDSLKSQYKNDEIQKQSDDKNLKQLKKQLQIQKEQNKVVNDQYQAFFQKVQLNQEKTKFQNQEADFEIYVKSRKTSAQNLGQEQDYPNIHKMFVEQNLQNLVSLAQENQQFQQQIMTDLYRLKIQNCQQNSQSDLNCVSQFSSFDKKQFINNYFSNSDPAFNWHKPSIDNTKNNGVQQSSNLNDDASTNSDQYKSNMKRGFIIKNVVKSQSSTTLQKAQALYKIDVQKINQMSHPRTRFLIKSPQPNKFDDRDIRLPYNVDVKTFSSHTSEERINSLKTRAQSSYKIRHLV